MKNQHNKYISISLLILHYIVFKTTKHNHHEAWREKKTQAAHLLRSWVRIPPGAWIFVCCECRALSGRGLCDELITRPEEYYRLWCVVVCDLETSRIGAPYIYDISSLSVNVPWSLLGWCVIMPSVMRPSHKMWKYPAFLDVNSPELSVLR